MCESLFSRQGSESLCVRKTKDPTIYTERAVSFRRYAQRTILTTAVIKFEILVS